MLASVVTQILILFLTACVGFLAARLGYFDDSTTAKLNRLLLNVCVPCLVLSSATSPSSAYGPQTAMLALAGSAGICLFLPLSGWLLNVVLRTPRSQRPLFQFMTICCNVGFMGYPVVEAFYGHDAMFLNSLAIMFQGVLMFTFGVALLTRGSGRRHAFSPRDLLTPGLVASVVALALFFTGVRLPQAVLGTLSNVGGITSPLAMMLIGASMRGVDPKSLFNSPRMHLYTIIKQLVIPLAVWFALVPVFPDRTVLGVIVLALSMPVGAMVIVFADQYHADTKLAVRAIALTTLYSFVVLPVLGLVIV